MATRENKLKAFFRSRSRSQTSDTNPSVPDRPPARFQTRPISSTTTATHSTIAPLPSDSWRNRPRHAYSFHPHSTDTYTSLPAHDQCSDYDSDDNRLPRSETPSSTRPKLVWHSLFGISLTRKSSSSISTPSQSTSDRNGSTPSDPKPVSSRKRSFRISSRPSTPKSIDSSSSKSPYPIPVPSCPLPLSASPRRRSFGLGSSQRTTPKSSSGHLPLPHVQPPQPGRSHGRRHSVGSERPPHDSAVALPEERSLPKFTPDSTPRNKGKEREHPSADSSRDLPLPSQSLPADPSPLSRNHLSPDLARPPVLPTVDSVSSDEIEHPPHRLHVIPRIIHTPPTPQRPGELFPSNTPPKINAGKIQVAKGKAVVIAPREHVLVSSSHSHPTSKGRFTARFLTGRDVSKTNDPATKRLPLTSSDGPTHKPPGPNIAGSARNMTSHRGKLGSFDFERPVSALNRSNSAVDRQKALAPLDKTSYSKGRLHTWEQTLPEESARGATSPLAAQVESSATPLKPDHTGDTSVISFSTLSLQTKSTGKDVGSNTPPGQSSSWGRASGRRALRTSHGTFAFEHASSLPNSPIPHTFNLPSEPHQNGLPGGQPSTPLHTKHSRGRSYNTSDHVEPGGRKPKGKGRSLDLGLGLYWAPSRLREEVLMPGSILAREKVKNRANGTDVTKRFERLLSESRFQTFKKYVRSFDAHVIPLEGPSGLLASVEQLLTESGLGDRERKKLMSDFTVFVENHGG